MDFEIRNETGNLTSKGKRLLTDFIMKNQDNGYFTERAADLVKKMEETLGWKVAQSTLSSHARSMGIESGVRHKNNFGSPSMFRITQEVEDLRKRVSELEIKINVVP